MQTTLRTTDMSYGAAARSGMDGDINFVTPNIHLTLPADDLTTTSAAAAAAAASPALDR